MMSTVMIALDPKMKELPPLPERKSYIHFAPRPCNSGVIVPRGAERRSHYETNRLSGHRYQEATKEDLTLFGVGITPTDYASFTFQPSGTLPQITYPTHAVGAYRPTAASDPFQRRSDDVHTPIYEVEEEEEEEEETVAEEESHNHDLLRPETYPLPPSPPMSPPRQLTQEADAVVEKTPVTDHETANTTGTTPPAPLPPFVSPPRQRAVGKRKPKPRSLVMLQQSFTSPKQSSSVPVSPIVPYDAMSSSISPACADTLPSAFAINPRINTAIASAGIDDAMSGPALMNLTGPSRFRRSKDGKSPQPLSPISNFQSQHNQLLGLRPRPHLNGRQISEPCMASATTDPSSRCAAANSLQGLPGAENDHVLDGGAQKWHTWPAASHRKPLPNTGKDNRVTFAARRPPPPTPPHSYMSTTSNSRSTSASPTPSISLNPLASANHNHDKHYSRITPITVDTAQLWLAASSVPPSPYEDPSVEKSHWSDDDSESESSSDDLTRALRRFNLSGVGGGDAKRRKKEKGRKRSATATSLSPVDGVNGGSGGVRRRLSEWWSGS